MGVHQHPSQNSRASARAGTDFIFEIAEDGDIATTSRSERNQDRTTTVDFRRVGYEEHSEFFRSNNVA